jgi:hypothetical protein
MKANQDKFDLGLRWHSWLIHRYEQFFYNWYNSCYDNKDI